ncbi:hypothetical protein EXU57_01035 [Segetibacter sp. 3557_3]|uniref:DUF5695 domain-containing protein n=1 Tax=Segetibacter sp. 3557_3 TaxID=2547429 RepID=UPI00105908E5|nr:DUF5695 domain-containing protein [Segetibacter sp. 3557_3]TDH28693.1 hypothetical protein EXU57_01035 [Segetibacter sp. 3557_3]
MKLFGLRLTFGSLLLIAPLSQYAQSWKELAERSSVLNLEQGSIPFQSASFSGGFLKSSQTLSALHPKSDTGFDFTPGDRLKVRSSKGMYHPGDLNMRIRQGDSKDWKYFSTATDRKPVTALPAAGAVLAAADLSNTLPDDIPLNVKRFWQLERGQLILRFELVNRSSQEVEIGSMGIPLIFNNILEGNTLVKAHAKNVLYDPYLGLDAGYLQVTRLHGRDSTLLVLPYNKTPFEAYNPLNDDPTPRGVAFEGFYEWVVCSKAYAENEWKAAEQWNQPTSIIVKPGETKTYGLRFVLAGPPAGIEKSLMQHNRPVAVGIPGYVLPQDVNGSLFINYKSKVKDLLVEPAGALTIGAAQTVKNGWKSYAVRGTKWGRARITIRYDDGLVQTVHYKVIKPERETVSDYGNFSLTKQWFEKEGDPFGRSPSVITYDNEKKEQVVEDSRAWVSGLSDEGGAGSWLGAVMKQSVIPNKSEIDKLQRFINQTMWGRIQVSEGPTKFGVRKSVFYYEPDSLPAGTYKNPVNLKQWTFWRKKEANSLGRSYNYPHVAAAHWVMYRLARNHTGLVTDQTWDWYLANAYETAMAMVRLAPQYAEFGQMEGTIFYLVLKDLKAEGKSEMSAALEAAMKQRTLHWASLPYPFGSEMPWDSTGQEEVYIWSLFFGYEEKAAVTLDAILAYMPTIPHWAYNGNARRYWDFLYAGGLRRVERMIHHYGSPLNAIPVLTEYRRKPDNFYLLRVGYGGVLGALSNITEEGFAPTAFHSYPSTLKNDPISGDYGSGFFGYAINSATYLVQHPDFGWLAFGGNVTRKDQWIEVSPTTAGRRSVFIAPAGVSVNLKAGQITKIAYQPSTGQIKIQLDVADQFTPKAFMSIEQPAAKARYGYKVGAGIQTRDNYEINLGQRETEVVLVRVNK